MRTTTLLLAARFLDEGLNRRWAALVVALAAAAGLTGCLTPGGDDAAPASVFADGERLSYFHSAMTLVPAPEENASVLRTGAFFQRWVSGDDYPTWVADPFGRDTLVTGANVTLFVRVTGPVLESARFPDIMVYAGSGDAWMGYGERRDFSTFEPGRLYEVDVEIGLPPGGLWLPPTEGFGLKVVPVMLQQDERADVEILLGGDDASRVRWSVAALDVPPATQRRDDETGEVIGTIYAGPAAPPTTNARVILSVPPGAAYVAAWMNTTDNVGIPDIDLSIEAPNGDPIATSGTPTPREAIRIAGPNLRGAGEYTLVVTTAGSPRAAFQLEWIVGTTA